MYLKLSAFTAQLNIAPVKNSVLKIGPTNLNYIPLGPRGGDNDGVIVIIQGLARDEMQLFIRPCRVLPWCHGT